MQARHIANRLWEGLASPKTALLILVVLSVFQITSFLLPQIPAPASQSTTYSRWLAEFRPRLGPQTGILASLGLLTVRSSLAMRVTLGILGLVVAVNLAALWEADASEETSQETRRNGVPRLGRAGHLLLAAGGILAIAGWMAQMLWGWREPGVIAWPGAQIALPQHALTLDQPNRFLGFWKGKAGLYILNRGQRTGLEIQATQEDIPLLLLPSVNQEPEEILHLALTAQAPEAFFATEDASLIFRLIQIPDAIQVQAYRSPSGEIVAEALLNGLGDSLVLNLDDVDVMLTSVSLPYYEIIFNPGAVPEAVGMACLIAGTIIRMNLSRRRRVCTA